MSKILIIEDEAPIRRVLTKILSEESDTYLVLEAEDGLQGIELVKNEDFDLILCDIKMPKMDGVEVLEAVKKMKPEIPMVMISGHGDLETAIQTMRLGAFDYISKPPDLNRLLNTVRNALDKKQLVLENKSIPHKFILRPRAIYGINDRLILPRLLKLVKGNRILFPKHITDKISLTHISNFISAIDLCIQNSKQTKITPNK
jgi:DNA-binding NtrC family response regulator